MTQHILQDHNEEDRRIMRRLGMVIAGFMLGTAALAVAVTAVMG